MSANGQVREGANSFPGHRCKGSIGVMRGPSCAPSTVRSLLPGRDNACGIQSRACSPDRRNSRDFRMSGVSPRHQDKINVYSSILSYHANQTNPNLQHNISQVQPYRHQKPTYAPFKETRAGRHAQSDQRYLSPPPVSPLHLLIRQNSLIELLNPHRRPRRMRPLHQSHNPEDRPGETRLHRRGPGRPDACDQGEPAAAVEGEAGGGACLLSPG